MTTIALDSARERSAATQHVPLSRVTAVELRKMFDTRSGFWLMASIGIVGVLTTVGTILFAPETAVTHYTFARAIGFPMTVLLPIIAVLAITGEWSQRSGLTTFTLVPHRHRVIAAKVIASLTVGVVAMVFALVIGVVGNLVGSAVAGTDLVWDVSLSHAVAIVVGSLLCLLTGTMLGIVFRSSPVALVAYFVYALILPTLFEVLAASQGWFEDLRPWIDLNLAESWLFEGTVSREGWIQLAVSAATWLVLPGVVGLRLAMRSEVK